VPEVEDREEPEAGRPFWSGTITFGLVTVPVNLLTANRSDRTSLRMVSPSGTPLNRKYFTQRDNRELSRDQIVRGYEVEKDRFVVVDDEELERLAPERSRDIDLRVFVKVSEIDPIHFERAYYLTPAGESTKAYRLLAKVMEDSGRAGIATFVMRGKEYLVAIIAENGILRAETLRFVDEIRTPQSIGLPEPKKSKAADVNRFERIIEKKKATRLDESELANHSSERLLKLVSRKRKSGTDVRRPKTPSAPSRDVIDLMEMLQRSLQGGGGSPRKESGGKAPLESRSKAELYEEAKALDIPGRSEMSKEELVEAIRAAG
jgi:DNA end-binding protein Ku